MSLPKLGEVMFDPSRMHHLTDEHGFAYIFSGPMPHEYPKARSNVVYSGKADRRHDKEVFDSLWRFFVQKVTSNKPALWACQERLRISILPADAVADPTYVEAALLEAFSLFAGGLPLANKNHEGWGSVTQHAIAERKPEYAPAELVGLLKSLG